MGCTGPGCSGLYVYWAVLGCIGMCWGGEGGQGCPRGQGGPCGPGDPCDLGDPGDSGEQGGPGGQPR